MGGDQLMMWGLPVEAGLPVNVGGQHIDVGGLFHLCGVLKLSYNDLN